ncbi:OR2 protein, partial [Acromyrmex charruanus]
MYCKNHQSDLQFRNGKHDHRIGSACFERASLQFKGLLQHMKDDWNNLLTSEETQILTHYAEKSRTLMLAYSISVIGFVFCYALLPLTEPVFDIILPLNETRSRKLPHLADFVILDQEKYYYTLLLILYVGYVVCVSIAVAADILYIFLVEHICGMYGVLCHRLRNLAAHDDLRWIDDDYIHEEIRRYVQHCIQLHDRIRLLIIVRMGSSEIMRYVALMLMQSCRLFFNSWAGQEVTDHSVEVSIAAYNGIWYNASVKVQKLLLFLIARSQKASQITIAKLYVINLEGFSKFLFIFKHPDDLDHIIELLPTLSGTVTCGVKFASLIYYFEKFKDLFQQFYDDWTNVSKKAEQIFRNYMEVSWRFTSIYTVWMATFVIGFALLPLVNPLLDVLSPLNITRPKKFIYPAEMLVDHEKYYYILLTIMYYVYFVACVVTLAIDTIYFAFIEHACALFDILKYELFSLDSMYPPAHKNKSVSINIRIQKCYIKIKELTQNYINLRFIDLINNTFAIYLFFEVGLGFVMHCTLCTMSVLQMNKTVEIIIYVALVVCQTARLFFYGWQGQQITDHSIDVYISAYNGAWYETSNTAKKMLLLLIVRSQMISEIKVAKSFVMNLENFTVDSACRLLAGGVSPLLLIPFNSIYYTYISLRTHRHPKRISNEPCGELTEISPSAIQDFRFNTNQLGMDVFDTRYFRVNKLLLSFFGLWPMQSTSNKNKRLCCTLFGILILLLPQIAFLFKRMRHLNDFYDVVPTFLGTCICLLKTIGLQWQTEKFRMLIQHVCHDWCLLAKYNDIWILMEYMERSRMFTLVFLIFTLTGAASFVTAPLTIPLLDSILMLNVTRTKRMPHPTEFFLDMEKYYYILLALTIVGYSVCCTVIVATDTIYLALLQHTCGTLAILSYRLKRLATRDKPKKCFDPTSKEDGDVENMINCIQLQIRIERLIYLIESTFATCLISDIGLGILLQCTACVMIVTRTELVRNGPLVLIQSLRFFFNSWLGQKIIDHSSKISVAAYNGMWYQTCLEVKKMLLFLLMKCQKPYHITMLKLYVICLENYGSFWGLATGITDLSIIMENTSQILVNSMIAIKLINCVFTNDKMKVLLEDVKKTWKIEHTDAEKKILQHYAEKSRTFTIGYAIVLYATWLFYSTTSIVVSGIYMILPTNKTYTAKFLYRIDHVLDIDKYFELLMLHGFISVFYLSSVPLAVDTTFTLCTHHICALFECLRYNIERIRGLDFILLEPNIKDDEVYRDIIGCIKSYQHALKFSDVLSSNYATSFFFLLGNVIISLSFGAAQLLMVDNQLEEIVRLLAVTLAQLLHIYFLSLISQRLIDHSSGLQNVIYSCDWYKISRRSKHLLSFTLLRSTKPCQLIAGNMFVMSMENFSSIFWGLAAGITDLSIIMENVSPLLVNSLIIIKFINCVFTNDKMKVLLEDIEETWKIKHTDSEKKILQHYAEKSRTFTIRYAIVLYATWLSYSTTSLVVSGIYTILPTNETYTAKFLYRIDHVLDIDKYFELLMLHGFISVFYLSSVPLAVDTTFTLCTHHICALFECLRYNIERIRSSDFVLLEPNIKDDEVYRDIIGCIKSYQHALKFSDMFSSNYATSFLFQLGNVIVSLSFGAAELIMDNQLDEIIRILSANLAQLIHIYFLSLISQRLIDHSSGFQNVIYSCDWYKISRRSKQLLRFTLLRTTKPCQIIAGNMFVMSMENFSSILKVSLSYFTMLTSLQ